jgi:hypothetical protein
MISKICALVWYVFSRGFIWHPDLKQILLILQAINPNNTVRKYLILTALLFAVIIPARAQDLEVGFQWGQGSFNMNELKEYNERMTDRFGFDAIENSIYPPHFYYEYSLNLILDNIRFGFLISSQSTGSRHSRKDYSAEYIYDTRIKSTAAALTFGYIINPQQKLQFTPYSELGVYLTKLAISESLEMEPGKVIDDNFDYKASNLYLEPGIRAGYHIIKALQVYASCSYVLQFQGKALRDAASKEGWLYFNNFQEAAHANWSGYRIGIGLSLNLAAL